MRFKVGQLITAKHGYYSFTSDKSLCIIKEIRTHHREDIKVEIVAHRDGRNYEGWISSKNVIHCTYAQFMERYPNARLVSSYTAEQLIEIKNEENMEGKEMELRMNKEKIGNYVLSAEERAALYTEITGLLTEYDYHPSATGVNRIIDEWIKNKGWLVNLFKQHPNYNGKYQIAFSTDFTRTANRSVISNFAYWLEEVASYTLRTERKIGAFSYKEICEVRERLAYIYEYMLRMKRNNYYPLANGKTSEEIALEKKEWDKRQDAYHLAELRGEIKICSNVSYDTQSWNYSKQLKVFAGNLRYNVDHIATQEFADMVNSCFPEAKAVAGQKVSRIVNKVCTITGVSKLTDYNREFAKYSDGLNPLTIKRHTILSCHPVDYFTMSFGNSWASCHTIDKHNKRGMPDSFSGCYSSGTLSYMLDPSSFVFYTVDKDYNGDQFELQDKVNRNMFHIGEDKLIQARVYPQATDGETGIYRQFREVVQKVIADCLGVPNLWKNVKGSSECCDVIYTKGTHYTDYSNFDDCNVSYLKDETETINRKEITVGHRPICPCCGDEHGNKEAIECDGCYDERRSCYNCGDHLDEDDMHYIDGDWYCEDCCFYCEYHDEWEAGDPDDTYYVEGYGRVCEEAFEENSDFYECEYCHEYFYVGNRRGEDCIETEDGNTFHCRNCAERAGYTDTSDGDWYPENEVHFCEHCEQYVYDDDWNEELNCCTDCEDLVAEQAEEKDEEEREAV